MERLALKSECAEPLTVELGGREAGREFATLRVVLPPCTRVAVDRTFYSLAYIHAGRRPELRVGLHCALHGEACIIPPQAWDNIWIYGLSILLAGYMSCEEFHRKAQVLPAGSFTPQYARTRTKNLFVPASELRPLGELFERLHNAP